jgi:hypothetical protein
MAEAKTRPTRNSVNAFIAGVSDKQRRSDCKAIVDLMADITQAKPEMWGSSIVGFGRYKQKYASGREAEWMIMGFSPRKSDLTLYVMPGVESFPEIIQRLGKYKTVKACLYIKKLEDVDFNVLRELLIKSVESMAARRVDK